MDYSSFLEFMTVVQEKTMGLRDWVSHRSIKAWEERSRKDKLPRPRAAEQRPKIMQKNVVFDYQVMAAVGLVDKLFARGAEESKTAVFPELKVAGQTVFNEIEDDSLKRWERFK